MKRKTSLVLVCILCTLLLMGAIFRTVKIVTYNGQPLIDLDALIEEQLELFDNREDLRFDFVRRKEDGSAWVDGRRSQLARVLVNLITNAIQAIDSTGTPGGQIRISLTSTLLENAPAWRIDIDDNGPGVSEEDMAKLFTPNFTTKKTGTGLGLAICRSIIEQSQGTIGYSRSDLGGARFTITLPAGPLA